MKQENKFKQDLKAEILARLPGSIVLHLDPQDIQGVPDMLVLYNDRWAALEGKKSAKASHRPNQDYYVDKLDDMSFARFIFPENKEEVLNDLQQTFQPRRTARLSRREQVPLD